MLLVVVVVVTTYNMQTIMMVPVFINWCNQPRLPALAGAGLKTPVTVGRYVGLGPIPSHLGCAALTQSKRPNIPEKTVIENRNHHYLLRRPGVCCNGQHSTGLMSHRHPWSPCYLAGLGVVCILSWGWSQSGML